MKTKYVYFVFLLFYSLNAFSAASEPVGFQNLFQEKYPAAKKAFEGMLKTDPKNAEALFGMGEYYYYTGKTDSARIFYQKGVDANSSYAPNYAGLGKIALKNSPAEAESDFKTVVKKSRKDARGLVCISKAYFDLTPPNLEEASQYINMALELDSKNAYAYYLDGLILEKKNDASTAASKYEQAIYFDPNLYDAYFKISELMADAKNPAQAEEYIKKVIALNPQYWLAYKKLAEVEYDNQKYADAATTYATYFKNVPEDKDRAHYAYSLFFNKQYSEAKALIDKLSVNNPNDYILLRLDAYISFESNDLTNARNYFTKFFSLVPEDKILTDDYLYYGKTLAGSGSDSLAIVNYMAALKKEPDQTLLLDELARAYYKTANFEQAIKYELEYLKKKPSPQVTDYFQLGRTYYSAANALDVKADSLKQQKYYHDADSLFTKVAALAPQSYLGIFWRARVNSAIDKETSLGLAKPFYEETLAKLAGDPVKYKVELAEIYAYLGFYYYLKDDKQNSLDNWKKLQQIEPDNPKAEEAIKALEKKK
jgi:tetratricopeptide (TPR) repeat protein